MGGYDPDTIARLKKDGDGALYATSVLSTGYGR